jgi:hypothetical protein
MVVRTAFRQAVENEPSSQLDRIETRRCSSDNYDGVQYKFYGNFIPVMPIIEVVSEAEGRAIEEISFTNDVENPFLGVFVADLPQQDHSAFTPE